MLAMTGRFVGQSSGPQDIWHYVGLALLVALVVGLMIANKRKG